MLQQYTRVANSLKYDNKYAFWYYVDCCKFSFVKNDQICTKYENFRITVIVPSYNIVLTQFARVASPLKYVRLIIHFNTTCTGINFSCDKWWGMGKYEKFRAIVGKWHAIIVCQYSTQELQFTEKVVLAVHFDTMCTSRNIFYEKWEEVDKRWIIKVYCMTVLPHNIVLQIHWIMRYDYSSCHYGCHYKISLVKNDHIWTKYEQFG